MKFAKTICQVNTFEILKTFKLILKLHLGTNIAGHRVTSMLIISGYDYYQFVNRSNCLGHNMTLEKSSIMIVIFGTTLLVGYLLW